MINVFGNGVCPGVRGSAEIVGGPTGAGRKCPLRSLSGVSSYGLQNRQYLLVRYNHLLSHIVSTQSFHRNRQRTLKPSQVYHLLPAPPDPPALPIPREAVHWRPRQHSNHGRKNYSHYHVQAAIEGEPAEDGRPVQDLVRNCPQGIFRASVFPISTLILCLHLPLRLFPRANSQPYVGWKAIHPISGGWASLRRSSQHWLHLCG
jgi:hypothetical protein